jgi:restriction endonuclease S subunit
LRYTGINIEGLRNLPVELPPIEQQREIVERIQMTFLQIDALSEDANRASDGVTF